MRCRAHHRCLLLVLVAQLVRPALARPVDPPVISVVFQQRLVDLSLFAEGDPADATFDAQTVAPGNGSFTPLHNSSISGNLGTAANGLVSQDSAIEQFRIKGKGQTITTSTSAGPDATASAGAGSVMFIQFTVADDTMCSLSGELVATAIGASSFGQAEITLNYFKPNGAGVTLTEFVDGQLSADPKIFFHVFEVKGNTQMLLSVTAQSFTGDIGSSTLTGTAKFSFSLDFGDEDEDGLLDAWETDGIDIGEDDTIDINLKDIGALPRKKNIFVELDAMTGAPVDTDAIGDVIAAFSLASSLLIQNPDNSPGVILHVTVDEQDLDAMALSGTDWPSGFDTLKEAHFGSTDDRTHPAKEALLKARARIFRYCLWATNLTLGGKPASGVGETPGNDFIVNENFVSSNFANAPRDARAGTFMHELGHTLGLRHDGGMSGGNFRPNYISVMNYAYQAPFTGSEAAWFLDYSKSILPPLDENALSETTALGGTTDRNLMYNPAAAGQPPVRTIVPADASAVDWNRDGSFLATLPQDISRLHPDLPASPEEEKMLSGAIDWNHLWYRLSGSDNFENGIGRDPASLEVELDETEIQAMHTTVVIDLTNTCPADIDDSGDVGIEEFLAVLAAWGTPDADVDGDGNTGITDFLKVLADWGPCP